ncbi:MAG: hypothetical protein LUG51_07810 [Tannerellaceae bacterium]|nr:hypothetical protein [Tannerellaceae bacterium]
MIIHHNERYYIALNESTQLDDIILYQDALIELLKVASTAQIFDGAENAVFNVCRLWQELSLTAEQTSEMELLTVNKVFREKIPEPSGGKDKN